MMKVGYYRIMALSMGAVFPLLTNTLAWGEDTWHVDVVNCTGVGDGETPEDPFCTIQQGFTASSEGDTVLVSPGTYVKVITFPSWKIELRSAEGPACTTITRTFGSIYVVSINSGHGRDTVLEGFTITGAAGAGYGIKVTESDPTIRNCIVTLNHVTGDGGGIGLFSSYPLIEDTVISENEGDTGGGIYITNGREGDAGIVEIVRCTIVGNKALGTTLPKGVGGGIIVTGVDNPNVHIYDSVITDNEAGTDGGGIGALSPQGRSGSSCSTPRRFVTIVNTLIARNTAGGNAGGVYIGDRASGTIKNCTITGNTAAYDGGGIYSFCSVGYVHNSILWDDSSDEIDLAGNATLSVTYSDVEGGYAGIGNINENPNFVDTDDYRLFFDDESPPVLSLCVDAGNNDDVVAGYPDLDGGARIVNGDGALVVDMGAYEYDDCDDNGDCDDEDICNGAEVCGDGNCRSGIDDGNGNLILDFCDFNDCGCDGGDQSEDCNDNGEHDGGEEGGPFGAELISATPAHEESLWRIEKNIVRLTFACDIDAPTAGDVKIRKMLDDGLFDVDLSSSFSFTVENDRVLRIYETTSVLDHREWYAIGDTDDSWEDAACFERQYLLQVGDATNDKFVTVGDLSAINANMGAAPDYSRFDIDGSGSVTAGDLSIANAHMSGYVPEPTDHDDDDDPCE